MEEQHNKTSIKTTTNKMDNDTKNILGKVI